MRYVSNLLLFLMGTAITGSSFVILSSETPSIKAAAAVITVLLAGLSVYSIWGFAQTERQ